MTIGLLEKEPNQSAVVSGDDDVRQYLREIRRFPLLTPGEERELARRCAAGDEDAIRQMVNSNLRLVVSVAREYAGRGVPLLDLIQEGSIGLIVAAKKFDFRMDYRFSTYATKWIRQRVTRYLMDHAGLIRVPTHTAERMRKISQARSALLQETGREPDAVELSRSTGIPPAKVEQLLQLTPETCSLDAPAGEDGQSSVGQLLPQAEAAEPQEEMIRQELKSIMERLLERLTERQRQILRLRFGIEDGVSHTREEIGQLLGISKERVRQIENQAMEKLQRLGADFGLEDFLE